ncbi:NACHT domain-containing protein [Corallococcus praedator]|uniref:non-specific serine/threonine protein kinase n=1 Tax=Corallococcus praedator TaxID=2316724 RepID=A0ABX9QRB8_9BACT|nr:MULTISPECIES: SUMF1/EgtB/PvdO family nonheme iron enzyme [Corallococcus]RKH35909.1 NACHT domain-containing protein [Corallococcus sp. CA031C]RKI17627.1 NACHT domain-containing protein [Corallococcus praedator]
MSSPPGPLLEPPREFEEYRLLRPLGQGAMGQVFLAQDTLLDRQVAVKFIATPAGRLPDATARARFFQEARAIARLQHPNVVAIHRVGEVRGQPYLVSELIRGESLDRLARPVEGGLALRLGIDLARGLAAAHRRGILHRDLKPANAVLSEDGEVKLLDFGLAEWSQWTEPAVAPEKDGTDDGAGTRSLTDDTAAQVRAAQALGLAGARATQDLPALPTASESLAQAVAHATQDVLPRPTGTDDGAQPGTRATRDFLPPSSMSDAAVHAATGVTRDFLPAPSVSDDMANAGTRVTQDLLPPRTVSGDTAPEGLHSTQDLLPLPALSGARTQDGAHATQGMQPLPTLSGARTPEGSRATQDLLPLPALSGARTQDGVHDTHGFRPLPALLHDTAPEASRATHAPRSLPTVSGDTAPEAAQDPRSLPAATSARGVAAPPATGGNSSLPVPAALAGTPLYMAPELWRGEPASRASDVYALGVLLYELCAGVAPHDGVPLEALGRAVEEHPPRPLADVAPALPPGLAAVVDRCLSTNPAHRFASGDALREALEALSLPARVGALPTGNPYRGLQPFEAAHRGVFFGRESEVRDVLDRLRGDAFVLLAGDSGVGKSSLCRAGILPALAAGSQSGEGGPAWAVVSCTPGRRPLDSLVEALAPLLDVSAEALLATVETEEGGALARALRRRPPHAPQVLLFVDQLEELVTFSEPAQAARLSEELALVVRRAPRTRVLATARSDCLTRLVALPGLGEEVPRALHLLRALSEHGLREAVVGPVRALGVRFESPELEQALVTAAARTEGGLPLLQFTLAALWEARDRERGLIPATALETLGGVEGALARHADAVVARLRPEQRPRARELLLELVTPEGTRLRRTVAELLRGPDDAAGRSVLEGLVQGRLLTAGEGEGGEGVYTLAHESLLTGWDTLRGWMGEDEQRRAVRHRLERAAAEWDRLGRPVELLYAGRQLTEASDVGTRPGRSREQDFLARSRQVARRRRAVRWTAAIAAPLALLGAVVVTRLQARAQLESRIAHQLSEARSAVVAAHTADVEAQRLRTEAFAHFDALGSEHRDAAEKVWSHALEVERAAEAQALRALSALETAWGLDPGRANVRDFLADLLAERVARSALHQQPEAREQWLKRLALYDASGVRRAELSAPARLSVVTSPPGARVRLLGPKPEDATSPGRELGQGPVRDAGIPPGSHVLLLEAPGRAPVRAPVLLRPGETLTLDLKLPPVSAVPEGFVYVPPGRFLQGASESEYLRRNFFYAAPLHETRTDGYLIARHEVTFGDYIAFLASLSAKERALRRPGNRQSLTGVELVEESDGRWRLELSPASAHYRVREGEPVRYGKRDRRAVQDWRRFPVSAISFEDAQAYVVWLDRTGQVPGARLCTEREWERAARGADGRRYPGGDGLEADDANVDRTYGREPQGFGPDEVGSHPRSRSPFGVDDLAGNVWEWTRSDVVPGHPSAQGGSWYQSDLSAHSANRDVVEPTQREALMGMRVCATPRF